MSSVVSSQLTVPPAKLTSLFASSNKSLGSYDSRNRKRLTLSCEMSITSDKRVQLQNLGSLSKNPIYMGKVHRAVGGRVKVLMSF